MDIILAFVWGMITVVYTLMALVVVQMRKSVKELESQIRDTNETFHDVYRQLEEKEGKSVDYTDKLHNNLYDEMNKMYGYVDSRFDKFQSKLKSDVSDEVQRIKTLLDEFVKTYQNQ